MSYRTNPSKSSGVPSTDYTITGEANSIAWWKAARYFDVPEIEQKMLVRRAVKAEDRANIGCAESAADCRSGTGRDDNDIVDKHVLMENPLASTTAEAETRAVQLIIGFNYRRVPALALARELIAEGRLGAVRHIRAAYLQDWLSDTESPVTWRLRKEIPGPFALGDIAAHAIAQVVFLLGDAVTEVTRRLHTFMNCRPGPDSPEEVTVDAAWATLTLASGTITSVEVSRMARGQKNSLKLEIYGDRGTILFDTDALHELGFLDATAPLHEQGFQRILVKSPISCGEMGRRLKPNHGQLADGRIARSRVV